MRTDAVAYPAQVLTSSAELRALEPEWTSLVWRHPDTSYFASPDWILSWTETVGAHARVRAAVFRAPNGELQGVVPIGLMRHRLHRRVPLTVPTWTNLGSGVGAADHCGWAVDPERSDDVRRWLAETPGSHSVVLSNLDPATGSHLLPPGARRVRATSCPRIEIPADPDKIGSSAKFRKQLRAYHRKIERLGITFRWVAPGAMTRGVLDTVFDLHERRSTAAGWATMFTRDKADLHRRLITRGGPGRGPAAVLAEQDGVPVGVLYGFRWRDVFAYYQTGWRPDLAESNLATVIVAQAIQLAGSDGAAVFDFLRGAEAYKYRFGAADRVDETWLLASGAGGLALRAKFAVAGD